MLYQLSHVRVSHADYRRLSVGLHAPFRLRASGNHARPHRHLVEHRGSVEDDQSPAGAGRRPLALGLLGRVGTRIPIDLRSLIDPSHTALLTVEVQEAVVGARAALPALSEAVAASDMLPNIAALARAARAVGVPVVHCTAESRADGFGANRNSKLFAVAAKARTGKPAPPGVFDVHADVGASPTDIVLPRLHGASPMAGTSLDTVLRNEGITTIVATGVSVNVALLGLVFDAVNRAYQVVVPRDAVCGVDPGYVNAVLENTVSLLATLTTTKDVLGVWNA